MPNTFVENKDRWLQIANGDFDYSILFIKCFLPFNAWYCNNYPQHNNKDSTIISSLKKNDNIFKSRVISLLEGDDAESNIFKEHLVNLHNLLERIRVPNNTNRITFKDLNFRENPNKAIIKNYHRNTFKVESISPVQPHNIRVKVDILKSSDLSTNYTYSHNKYDLEHLKVDNGFATLSLKSKEIIIELFKGVNPRKSESLIVDKKKDSLATINTVFFIKDTDLLAQAIIEIIYRLRCILFHGEIVPTKDNLKIYESAYYMLRLLIKSLI